MQINFSTYIPGNSVVHRCDARVKIVVLFVYSLALLLVPNWWGMGLLAAIFIVALVSSKVPAVRILGPVMIPVYILAVIVLLCHGVPALAASGWSPGAASGLSPGAASGWPQVATAGLSAEALNAWSAGFFAALRIILLVAMSLLVSYTTTSTQVMQALAWMLAPLERLHVPVRDIVLALTLALRFVPVVAEEFCRIHDAQQARGSAFARDGLWGRMKAWGGVFVPLFVSLFRRADNLATALDSRCYDASHDRI